MAAEAFISRVWAPLLDRSLRPPKDAKTALQEWAQGHGLPLPIYETVSQTGPDHDPMFSVRARVKGFPPVTATGRSKRSAEQIAAESLLAMIGGNARNSV